MAAIPCRNFIEPDKPVTSGQTTRHVYLDPTYPMAPWYLLLTRQQKSSQLELQRQLLGRRLITKTNARIYLFNFCYYHRLVKLRSLRAGQALVWGRGMRSIRRRVVWCIVGDHRL